MMSETVGFPAQGQLLARERPRIEAAGTLQSAGAQSGAAQSRGPAAQPAQPAIMPPNPVIRIDPALGIAVIEVRDENGKVTQSVPTERELEAYHREARRGAQGDPIGQANPAQDERRSGAAQVASAPQPARDEPAAARPGPAAEARPGGHLDVDT